jgi:hypothetical protein
MKVVQTTDGYLLKSNNRHTLKVSVNSVPKRFCEIFITAYPLAITECLPILVYHQENVADNALQIHWKHNLAYPIYIFLALILQIN